MLCEHGVFPLETVNRSIEEKYLMLHMIDRYNKEALKGNGKNK